jgi:hypothetical protein
MDPVNKFFRHYKGGGLYFVIAVAHDSDRQKDGDDLVIYRGTDGRVWYRPLSEFLEQVSYGRNIHSIGGRDCDLGETRGPRFTPLT